MQTTNEILKDIKNTQKRRRVTFSEDVLDYERPITFYHKTKKELDYSRIKKNTLRYLSEGKYEELNLYLKSYTPQELEVFYKKEGRILFSWAIIDAPSYMPLKFLVDNVPTIVTNDILKNNNFYILDGFFGGYKLMEKYGQCDQEQRDSFALKLNLLLQINSEEIDTFIQDRTSVAGKTIGLGMTHL